MSGRTAACDPKRTVSRFLNQKFNDLYRLDDVYLSKTIVSDSKGQRVARFGIVVGSALLIVGSPAAAASYSFSDRPSQDGRCIGDNGVGDIDRSENACLAQIGKIVQRIGPGLQIKFGTGYTKIYLNEDAKCQSSTADGCVKYQLTGYFPEHNIILIEVDYWEGVSWLLVWIETGESAAVVAPPHYSPDKRWLASVASTEGPSGPPNGMDIVPSTSIRKLGAWHYRTPSNGQWLYEFGGWDGNARVTVLASSLGTPQRRTKTAIERRNGEWRFSEPR